MKRPALLPLGALLVPLAAVAVPGGPQRYGNQGPRLMPTLEDLARDLAGDERNPRLLAARELRRRVKIASRSASARPGSIAELEARAELGALTRLVVPPCERLLMEPGIAPSCADMLGRLEEPSSCGPLQAAADDDRKWVARPAQRALGRLGETCAEEAE